MFTMPPPMMNPNFGFSKFGVASGIANIPPPPMPDLEAVADDKEALYSMLIAWYMSGYHTGYYQGLVQKTSKIPSDAESCQSSEQSSASSRQRNNRR